MARRVDARAATRAELEALDAYLKHRDTASLSAEAATCSDCGLSHKTGFGYYERCPGCHPEQPIPPAYLLRLPYVWPGPDFMWDNLSGQWRWFEEYMLVDRRDLRQLDGLLPALQGPYGFVDRIATELKRLRTIVEELDAPARERAERNGKRAVELADRCQRLEDDLTRKRAECDELRERLEAKGR